MREKVKDYYAQEAAGYIKRYQKDHKEYPANLIRINFIIEILKKTGIWTILDAGCGTCGPTIRLLREGFSVRGFDFSKEMVREGRRELKKAGYNPDLIYQADLENKSTLKKDRFDAALALGVFPHIADEKKALRNMGRLLKPNGSVFIEFRNELFAAYTLNKYSLDFFLNSVIGLNRLPAGVRREVVDFYSQMLKTERPAPGGKGRIAYADIPAKFHNPLSIEEELFMPCGFSAAKKHFYHYHALPPFFEDRYPDLFRELSLRLEGSGDWRGYLMASAYVIEAQKR